MNHKIRLVFLSLIVASGLTACQSSSQAESNTNSFNAGTQASASPTKKTAAEPVAGVLSVMDLYLAEKKPGVIYEIETGDFFGRAAAAGAGDEFDIMNEYGFLAKGKLVEYVKPTEERDGYWRAELLEKGRRLNLPELALTRMREREKELPGIPAFGVFPSQPGREKIRSGDRVETSERASAERQKVYLTLPKEIRDKADVYGEAGKLEYPNAWTDLDGDGRIDFVSVRVRCDERPDSHCDKKLYFQQDEWVEMPRRK